MTAVGYGRGMTLLIYICAAIVILLGIAFLMIAVDLIRNLWR